MQLFFMSEKEQNKNHRFLNAEKTHGVETGQAFIVWAGVKRKRSGGTLHQKKMIWPFANEDEVSMSVYQLK